MNRRQLELRKLVNFMIFYLASAQKKSMGSIVSPVFIRDEANEQGMVAPVARQSQDDTNFHAIVIVIYGGHFFLKSQHLTKLCNWGMVHHLLEKHAFKICSFTQPYRLVNSLSIHRTSGHSVSRRKTYPHYKIISIFNRLMQTLTTFKCIQFFG